MIVRFKPLTNTAKIPTYKTEGSAGCDVFSDEDVSIGSSCRVMVRTGLCMEVPEGYECQVRPRSGMALADGVIVLNSPGTIDSDYRGENKILLYNTGSRTFDVKQGDRIAQFVFAPVTRATLVFAGELSETSRGTGGWGSTGK